MNIENKKDEIIINNVLNFFNETYICHKYFTDGASSRVILLNNTYLIKQNSKKSLEAETIFLKLNKSEMFQKILYTDPNFEFVVYNFIPGNTIKEIYDVTDITKKILKITSNYSIYSNSGFGYLNEEVDNWSQFLRDEIEYSSKNMDKIDIEKSSIMNCVKILENYPFEKKLLHGDFGTHNFIENNKTFIGVIDPMPVIGDPLYDTLFAIASNPGILKHFPFKKLCKILNAPQEKIKSLLTIILYSRISRALKYSPNYVSFYVEYYKQNGSL